MAIENRKINKEICMRKEHSGFWKGFWRVITLEDLMNFIAVKNKK